MIRSSVVTRAVIALLTLLLTAMSCTTFYELQVNGDNGQVVVVIDGRDGVQMDLPYSNQFMAGQSVELTPVPSAGFAFVRWEGDASGSDVPLELEMASHRTVTMVFEAVPTGPANDAFANAEALSGASGSVSGSNVAASKQPGEPNHAGRTGGASVWWSYAAGGDGTLTVDTSGSGFDTVLGVYSGSSVDALSEVGSDDDGGPGFTSEAAVPVAAGTTYAIAVDGFSGQEGAINLNWSFVADESSTPDDATIIIDVAPDAAEWILRENDAGGVETDSGTGDGEATVSAGTYFVSASLAGYSTASDSVTVQAGDTVPVNLTLDELLTPRTLTIDAAGGSGTVRVDGVTEALPFSGDFEDGSTVAIEAVPAAGYDFTEWTGDVATVDNPTSVVMTADRSVTAQFESADLTLTVDVIGAGTGTVTSSPAGIDCGSDCTQAFPVGTTVELTATPDAASSSSFTGWGGACAGTASCTVTMDEAKIVTASFSTPEPSISLRTVPTSISFDGLVPDSLASDTVTIYNDGNTTASNLDVTENASWLTATPSTTSIAPNSSITVTVDAGTCDSPGNLSSTVYVSSSSANGDSVQFDVLRDCAEPAEIDLSVAPSTVSFVGDVGSTPPTDSITISNAGTVEAEVQLESNAAWLNAQESTVNVAPGASVSVALTASACSTVGNVSTTLDVTSATANGFSDAVAVTRECVEDDFISLSRSPTSLSFSGDTNENLSTDSFTVTNNGNTTANVSITDNQSWLSASPTSFSLSVGSSRTITVDAGTCPSSPTSQSGTITATGTSSTANSDSVTVSINRTCTEPPEPDITVSPSSVTRTLDEGQGTTVSATIRNDGNATLTYNVSESITGVSLSGVGSSLAPGASDPFTINLTCSSTTDRNGNITITSNDPNESTVTIPVDLTCNAVAPDIPSGVDNYVVTAPYRFDGDCDTGVSTQFGLVNEDEATYDVVGASSTATFWTLCLDWNASPSSGVDSYRIYERAVGSSQWTYSYTQTNPSRTSVKLEFSAMPPRTEYGISAVRDGLESGIAPAGYATMPAEQHIGNLELFKAGVGFGRLIEDGDVRSEQPPMDLNVLWDHATWAGQSNPLTYTVRRYSATVAEPYVIGSRFITRVLPPRRGSFVDQDSQEVYSSTEYRGWSFPQSSGDTQCSDVASRGYNVSNHWRVFVYAQAESAGSRAGLVFSETHRWHYDESTQGVEDKVFGPRNTPYYCPNLTY